VSEVRKIAEGEGGSELADVFAEIEAGAEGPGGPSGLPTGFAALDRCTGGLQPGELVLICGNPSVGASTLQLNIAEAVAIGSQLPALHVAVTTSRRRIVRRLLASNAGVPLDRLRSGGMEEGDWERLAEAIGRLGLAPLYVVSDPRSTVDGVAEAFHEVVDREGQPPALITIDTLPAVALNQVGERGPTAEAVVRATRELKALAETLAVPVLATTGTRARRHQGPRPPHIADVAWLTDDADQIWMLHREELTDPGSPPSGTSELHLLKNRDGPTAVLVLTFRAGLATHGDLPEGR
jgi:replicative DNA helicase